MKLFVSLFLIFVFGSAAQAEHWDHVLPDIPLPTKEMYKDEETGTIYKVIKSDPGGGVVERLTEIEYIKEDKKRRIIIDGVCASACTLYISLPPEQVCYKTDAPMAFHFPRIEFFFADQNPAMEKWGDPYDVLLQYYPKASLIKLIENDILFDGKYDFVVLPASEFINKCEPIDFSKFKRTDIDASTDSK